jgi:hypothetical protein
MVAERRQGRSIGKKKKQKAKERIHPGEFVCSDSIFVTSQKVREDIGATRVSFLKVAKPCLISLNGGLALKFI